MKLNLLDLGRRDYRETWEAMRAHTDTRGPGTEDALWLVEHAPVYTLGRNGDPAHILGASAIPVVESDRGGQVTYHGPGQLVVYTLFDLSRLGIGVRTLVSGLENAVIRTLAWYGIQSEARRDAPGVYVDGRKIASLGLRVRRGCSYHGLALNVDAGLAPFAAINPCGYPGLQVTSLADLAVPVRVHEVAIPLIGAIVQEFGFTGVSRAAPITPFEPS
ncbi:lipoyl(octanoyl) transferase LipB [Methylococcus sp. EFPC2]|uniref:lipoyl(octanoyl) transferase LipB n=1 Tax=Methylococcus sp. EFPC2 TaxID=2812648 RepID=UPI0019687176|nr:lipoyl(octanoyl) transferase LipB [Methylococcus sp. EFPC2]QSA95878.1 lipoyl(octanoyl) transferase LipB [Methylococcus sp. EFPC2]